MQKKLHSRLRHCIMQRMKQHPFLNSLTRRIQLGYCLLLLVASGLTDIRQRVAALETVSALSDTMLEIRHYEKKSTTRCHPVTVRRSLNASRCGWRLNRSRACEKRRAREDWSIGRWKAGASSDGKCEPRSMPL
jgi:hypothetical protein